MAVLIYNTNKGLYARFSDGRWMSNKNNRCGPINKLYYIPKGYNEGLIRNNLKELDEMAIINTKEGGKLIEVVSKNGDELIITIGLVNSIEKVGL